MHSPCTQERKGLALRIRSSLLLPLIDGVPRNVWTIREDDLDAHVQALSVADVSRIASYAMHRYGKVSPYQLRIVHLHSENCEHTSRPVHIPHQPTEPQLAFRTC